MPTSSRGGDTTLSTLGADRRSRIGSDQGAVPVFRLVRFPGPPTEPDVRLATHPALHQVIPLGYATDTVVSHGVGMLLPR